MLGTGAVGSPFGVIGQAVPVSVSTQVTNLGPDGPADADVTQSATGSVGATVTPASTVLDADGLAVGGSATVSGTYAVTCTGPGSRTVTFTSTVAPEKAKAVDLVAGNNSRTATFTIDCAVPVTVNVKPGSLRNPLNLNEQTIPVAVLSTTAGEYGNPLAVDARQIQAATVHRPARGAVRHQRRVAGEPRQGAPRERGRADPRRRHGRDAARRGSRRARQARDHRAVRAGQVRSWSRHQLLRLRPGRGGALT